MNLSRIRQSILRAQKYECMNRNWCLNMQKFSGVAVNHAEPCFILRAESFGYCRSGIHKKSAHVPFGCPNSSPDSGAARSSRPVRLYSNLRTYRSTARSPESATPAESPGTSGRRRCCHPHLKKTRNKSILRTQIYNIIFPVFLLLINGPQKSFHRELFQCIYNDLIIFARRTMAGKLIREPSSGRKLRLETTARKEWPLFMFA